MILALLLAVVPPDTSCYEHVRSEAQFVLVSRESRGNPKADNPRSSAFGCGQLIAKQRRHYGRILRINPNTTDPAEAIALMTAYITDRYGTDEKALTHHNRKGWY